MAKKNQTEFIRECYIQGLSLEQTIKELPFIAKKTIANTYTDLTVSYCKVQSNDRFSKLIQIKEIERELFKRIASNKYKPTAEANQQITELQNAYSKFLIY